MNYVLTLDKVFSTYIRLSDADENGMVQCVTCGDWVYWKTIDAGHFVRRSNTATRWLISNCHPQCFTCNRIRNGNLRAYREWMLRTYGPEKVSEIENLGHSQAKFTETELKEKIAYYRKKIKELKKVRDCSRLF